MKRFLLLLLVPGILTACTQSIDSQAEQKAIRAAWDASVQAALDGDFEGYAGAFSGDLEVVHPDVGLPEGGRSMETRTRI